MKTRIVRSLFFGLFLAMGLLFMGLLGVAVFDGAQCLLWKTTPATVVAGEVTEHGDAYRAVIRYTYRWKDRDYTSDVFAKPVANQNDRASAEEIVASLPPGTVTTCRVNPSDPAQAVLRIGNLWIGFFLLIPLVFVLLGAGGLWSTWKRPGARAASASLSRPGGLESRGRGGGGWLFGLIFLAIGVLTFVFFSVPMWQRAFGSMRWVETPCVVLSSGVKSHSGDNGATYSVDVKYRYTYDGREYTGDRYDSVGGSSSGYHGKAKVAARYSAGARAVCYVNPGKPYEALLRPGLTWGVLFGLFPLPFVAIGLFMVLPGRRTARKSSTPAMAPSSGGAEMRPLTTARSRMLILLLAVVIWNGVVALFAGDVIEGFQAKDPDWMLAFILLPFLGIGLVLIGAFVVSLLALGNPRVRLSLEPAVLRPGGSTRVSWEMTGAVRRIRALHIYLEGREEAKYRRGTSTTTTREVFARFPIVAISSSWMEMIRGEQTMQIPAGVIPTFRAANNQIVWSIKVRGEIDRWPDVAEEYEIEIQPEEKP